MRFTLLLALYTVSSANSLAIGEDVQEDKLIDNCCSLEGGVMLIHGIEVEGAMLAVGGFDLLVNIVVQLAGCKIHFTLNGRIDRDFNEDVVHSFFSGWEIAQE